MAISDLLARLRGATSAPAAPNSTDTIRKVVHQLDELEPERARFIAALAYLLGRVARADLHISEVEARSMEQQVAALAGLPEEQAVLAVCIVRSQITLLGGSESFNITQELNRTTTREQKLALLQCLFAVSAADESISNAEDREVRLIASELDLTHQDFIDARLAYTQFLSVRKA